MLCSWIVFLAGINQTDDYGGCIAVAVLLHYFILASFMWMLMEGILQYLLFVRVLGTYFENYMWKTAISAWVLPLVPIIVMLAIDIDLYNGGNTYCWMSLTGFYYGFSIPVGVIILANIIIYIMVTCSICNRRNINTGDSKSTSRSTLTNIRASFCCFIILGRFSWIFGFLAISDARLVFQYIFTIINSIQGFLIFALFTLRDKNVRDYWQELCCYRSKFNGQSSKQRTKTSSESAAKNSSDLTFSDVRKNSTTVNDINSNDQRQEPYTQQL
ncbi:hypothetical protein LOTGIDRAFT_126903 [Lottia gigantea]|uniref:G-protein coupled receptors family 2 profile 2 domain-containing protein n=1 Tax=Lottia gigantea TaxID=225164 RepID=V3ZZG8_LOTGI|nr:hypothetical protein LOTGIDRAFT_126903 [Lottia gigantea]ESO88055.1 hypothetical protein LOTGIDRAFT_126903 [Lottia gigantea]